jgi:hypothetical protein
MDNILNIFTVDKAGNALSDVDVLVLSGDQEIGRGTTRGRNKPVTVQYPSTYDSLTIEARYKGAAQSATIPGATKNFEFKFQVDPPPVESRMPHWFPVAGFFSGILTLLFFMGLVVAGIFGHNVPSESRFPVVIIMAFGLALDVSFIGGDAAAKGQIPFFKDSPVVFTVGGGIAAFVIALLLGWKMYIGAGGPP